MTVASSEALELRKLLASAGKLVYQAGGVPSFTSLTMELM